MIHLLKMNGHRIAYDCTHRTGTPISALAMKIAETVSPPLSEECPSSLRYAFAKYDSHDLNDAYKEVYALAGRGLFEVSADTAPASLTRCLHVTADEAEKIIRRALSCTSRLRVHVNGASPEQMETLCSAFEDSDICFISDLDGEALSAEDVERMNRLRCYVTASPSLPLSDAVISLAERGVRYIHANIPHSTDPKDLIRLAKVLEKMRADGRDISFAPFLLALESNADPIAIPEACRGCWAQEICRGRSLDGAGQPTARCEIERTCIECGIVLTQHNEKIV